MVELSDEKTRIPKRVGVTNDSAGLLAIDGNRVPKATRAKHPILISYHLNLELIGHRRAICPSSTHLKKMV